MAATGTPTPNIGLRIPLGTDPASVDDINYNSNLIDTKLGAVGNDSVQDQIDDLNSNIASIGTPVSWTPSMDGATLTNIGSNYVKIGKLVYLFCAFTCDIAVGDSGILDIAIPSAVAPGNDFQTVFNPVCINVGKQLYGRIYSNGLHIFNYSGQTLDAGATYQMFVVYAIAQ